MSLDPKIARNNLFPEIGTCWTCIKEYPTSAICYPASVSVGLIEPGDEVVFLAAKYFKITDKLLNDNIPFWLIWLLFSGIPVTIVWWEELPSPNGDIALTWNQFFQEIERQ